MDIIRTKKLICNLYNLIPIIFLFLGVGIAPGFASPSNVTLTVWVSEAAVATYTFDFENFVTQQKKIAKYFTADGWISFSKAMEEAKLPETIQKNSYYVSAVPTMPPVIKETGQDEWEATISILVVYKNPAYKQKQNLNVVINFIKSDRYGINGFAIVSLKSTVIDAPCRCVPAKSVATIV